MELTDIYLPVKRELHLVNKEIHRQLERIVEEQNPRDGVFIKEILKYLFEVPGKLLRPTLVLLSAKGVDGRRITHIDQLVQLATAVEFLHSASLIHDDIIDESEYRRNRFALNKKYGNQIAVLVGDIFYSQFFGILIGLRPPDGQQREKLLYSFSDTTRKLCFGEIFEHKVRLDGDDATFNEYLQVVKNKTACLFAASCMNGGLLNGADVETTTALYNYGLSLGYVFQIVDDFIDEDAIYGFDERMIRRAREYAESAQGVLRILPESRAKETLLLLPEFILSKVHVHHL